MEQRLISGQKTVSRDRMLQKLAFTAVLAAMITLFTAYLFHIPVGINGGYIHFGDALIYLGAVLLPMPYAMAAGAIGGGLADLLTSPVWAPATMIIKMLIVLPFSRKGKKIVTLRNGIALVVAFFLSAIGYYVAEGILFGFDVAFWMSISGSVIQSGGSSVLFLILGAALDKIHFKNKIWQQ